MTNDEDRAYQPLKLLSPAPVLHTHGSRLATIERIDCVTVHLVMVDVAYNIVSDLDLAVS
ncbi:hypothetical protein SLS57_012295 [Botryosphaeria dothidea]